jgi:hypothetical protein
MKLTQIQKEIVMKKYGKLGTLVAYEIEKLKLDYGTFEETMEVAYDYICEKAE